MGRDCLLTARIGWTLKGLEAAKRRSDGVGSPGTPRNAQRLMSSIKPGLPEICQADQAFAAKWPTGSAIEIFALPRIQKMIQY